MFMGRLVEVVGVAMAACCLATLTLPVTRRLQRWLGHAGAVVVTALITLAGSIVLAWLTLSEMGNQADAVAATIHDRLDDIPSGSLAGRMASAVGLSNAVDDWLNRLPSTVVVGDQGATRVGLQLVTLLSVIILAAFLQSSGRSIIDAVVARWPRDAEGAGAEGGDATVGSDDSPRAGSGVDGRPVSPRLVVRQLLDDVERRGVGAMRRSLVLAFASAAVVAAALALAGVPAAMLIAMWAGVWFVVPTLGWLVGSTPMVLLSLLDPSPRLLAATAMCAAIGLAVIPIRRRFIDSRTIRLGAAPHVVSVATGVAVAGLGGSLVALWLCALACAAVTSQFRPRRVALWPVHPDSTHRIAGVTFPNGWRGVLAVSCMAAFGVLVWNVLASMAPAIVWITIGGFAAIAFGRPTALLERRTRMTRQSAAGLLLTVVALVFVVATITGAADGARATTTITERLPAVVADLEHTSLIGGYLRDRDAAAWVEDQMNDMPQRLDRARPEEWLPSIGARLLDVFWTTVIMVALLFDGPRLEGAVRRRVPARHRRQYTRLVGAIGVSLGGYAAGAALVAAINGSVVFALAVVLGVGLAPILALWAFAWNFVPQIGGFMGGVPLVAFAFIAGPLRGLIAGLVFIAYQFVENHLIQPAVIGAAIDVAPWGTLLAALAGGAAAGVIGAIVVTPLVGIVRVVRNELRRDDFPGATSSSPAGRDVTATATATVPDTAAGPIAERALAPG
jgi:predicted PurR-regulated permease PerM